MTIDYPNLPQPYREAVAFFEAYRKCGFRSDDIFVVVAGTDGRVQLNVALKTQGREVLATAGFLVATREAVIATWVEVASAVSEGRVSQAHLDEAWVGSMAFAQKARLAAVLARKGILLPRDLPS